MKHSAWISMGVLLVLASSASAGSIFAKANFPARANYTDDTSRSKGDNLTIVISENSQVNNTSKRTMQKTTARSANMSGSVKTGTFFGLTDKSYNLPDVSVTGGSNNQLDGKADYTSNRSLTDAITVTVEDVLPNGNLVVLGVRTREIDGDTQIIQVSGIVRPSDVAFDNSINSDKVADFHIVLKKKGQENLFTTPGWFGKILNYISPS